MDTNVDYKSEYAGYWKVLVALLIFTAITFIQPGMFLTDYTFVTQMAIGTVKAWIILMYYMHLKGETMISTFIVATLAIVAVFFIIVGIDVAGFQYGDVSHITSPAQ